MSWSSHAGRPGSFQPLIHGVRWGTLVAGLIVAPVRGPQVRTVVACGLVLLAYTTWRTLRPLPLQPAKRGIRPTWPFLLDVGLAALAVMATGYWQSPFAFYLLTGVVAAGVSRGYAFAGRLAAATGLAVTVVGFIVDNGAPGLEARLVAQWAIELLLVAALAGYARGLFGDGELRSGRTEDRVAQLAEANELLVSLHRVAQQLPASLNLDTVLASTVSRVRAIIQSDVAAVVLRDEATGRWSVAAGDGTRLGRSFADPDLPPALSSAASSSVASLVVCLNPGDGLGSELLSHTGLYAPLRARGTLIGLIALEHHAPGSYGRPELQLLDAFIETAALSIDNARWFARLRAIGADEERVRIARDMHDRLGQSLATVGFGLDLVRRQVADERVAEDLDRLRAEVRSAVGEVRETLGDLRTEVTDERGLDQTLAAFLERVELRAGLEVNFTHHNGTRLPLIQERELWRIAQEAITNVERHAHARHLSVRWEYDGNVALLAIADDGEGFVMGRSGRSDSYGITGMRERADAIGASLEIDSAPGAGTVVRCRVGRPS